MEAALCRDAAATASRRERRCVRKAATATAKAHREARLVARAASATAAALAAKVKKLALTSSIAPGAPKSPAEHEALRQERRIRKKGKRVATADLKQARRVAAIFAVRVIEAGVGVVASRVVSAEEASEKFHFDRVSASFPGCPGRCCPPKSKTMPRRKRAARKSGSSINLLQLSILLKYLFSSCEWPRLAKPGGTIATPVSAEQRYS